MVCVNQRHASETAPAAAPRCVRVNSNGVSELAPVILFDREERLALTLLPVTFQPVSSPLPEPAGAARPPDSPGDFGAFFQKTLGPLRRYIARLVGRQHDSTEDIAQDAYAKVFTVMQGRKVDHPQALLYTTARNLAIDELKHRARSPFDHGPGVDTTPAGSPSIETIVMAREECRLLEQAINNLPTECRQVLLLRTNDHLTHEQIAHKLGLTRKQAEKRLYRAVQLLHTAMQAEPARSPS